MVAPPSKKEFRYHPKAHGLHVSLQRSKSQGASSSRDMPLKIVEVMDYEYKFIILRIW